MMTLDQLKSTLTEATDAYHQLATGRMARVFVDSNGERVEYTATNAAVLQQYIAGLQRQIAAIEQGRNNYAPMRFQF